nr:hypothetical protein SHINE37_40689 [Rhizobiaceae bacterium]
MGRPGRTKERGKGRSVPLCDLRSAARVRAEGIGEGPVHPVGSRATALECDDAAPPFSPTGRRWPEGSDEGRLGQIGCVFTIPLIRLPAPSHRGEKGDVAAVSFHRRLPCGRQRR